MNSAEFLALLEQTRAVESGHFQLSSGRHSPTYIQCARLLQEPDLAAAACSALAERFRQENVQVVIAPALGGIVVAHEAGRALGTRALFAERVEGRFALRRSLHIDPGERVLIVEDVVTTGGSTREIAELVKSYGGTIVGVGALVDRGGTAASPFPWRFEALIALDVPTYAPADCPQCAQGHPVTKPGSRPTPALTSR